MLVQEKLPAAIANGEPLPEGLLWLLLTGEVSSNTGSHCTTFQQESMGHMHTLSAAETTQVPSTEQVSSLSEELRARSKLPQHVFKVLDALPEGTHPMTQLSTAVMALQVRHTIPDRARYKHLDDPHKLHTWFSLVQPDSKFAAAYSKGINKMNYWDPIYEDSLDLIAKMPSIAATIYRRTYKGGKLIEADPKLDWAGNLAHQMGGAALHTSNESGSKCVLAVWWHDHTRMGHMQATMTRERQS